MIPILYDRYETAFASGGLGRLSDCISCIVTEERNGIYECEFVYPITGTHYDMIEHGSIVYVPHDDTGDTQPFVIYSHSLLTIFLTGSTILWSNRLRPDLARRHCLESAHIP